MRPTTPNILRILERGTVEEISHGKNWYAEANEIARDISGGNIEMGAGVISALSPMMKWDRNVSLARKAFNDGIASGAVGNSVRAANRILAGENPLDVLNGKKVRAFYSAIAGNDDIVIDRHAFDIAVGKKCVETERTGLSNRDVYERFVRAYARAAIAADMRGCEIQASTWVIWRRIHGKG